MLQLVIKDANLYDEAKETFINVKGQTIQLEHSLVSISKWEAKWHKPFLSVEDKTREETLDYIRCMTITQCVNPMVYLAITDEQVDAVNSYINDSMTATTFSNTKQEGKGSVAKVTTSEEIYYYMSALQIPFSCEKWHLNRLLTLIHVCDEKNKQSTDKKPGMPSSSRAARSKINKARRAKHHSKG